MIGPDSPWPTQGYFEQNPDSLGVPADQEDLERYNFVLVHGAWHGAEHWLPVAEQLAERGHDVIVPTLPIDNPEASFEDDVDAVEYAIKDASNLFVVTHSRGYEVLPRLLQRIGTERVIGALVLCSGGPHGVDAPRLDGEPDARRYREGFLEGVHKVSDNLSVYDPEKARQSFFSEITDAQVLENAIQALRLQRHVAHEKGKTPKIPEALPLYVCLGKNDAVVNNRRARAVFEESAGITPWEIDTGHSPQLEKPANTADLIVQLADVSSNLKQD